MMRPMRRGASRTALNEYNRIDVQTAVHGASPHRLIQMLLDGALARIAAAQGHMERGEIAQKGDNIGWSISIINSLRDSLNLQAGGEIAANLSSLYEYMERRLLHANLRNDQTALQEVQKLLSELRAGWAGIRDQADAPFVATAASE